MDEHHLTENQLMAKAREFFVAAGASSTPNIRKPPPLHRNYCRHGANHGYDMTSGRLLVAFTPDKTPR
ncbi:MAG TPA: hypothetical protein VMG59_02255 [Phycisphaerae bacterium]|nr:hypothetical protein [Phycisphaerae bacterium]